MSVLDVVLYDTWPSAVYRCCSVCDGVPKTSQNRRGLVLEFIFNMIDAFLRGASFAWEGRDDDDDGDDESTVKPSDASFVLLSFNWLIFH